MYKIDKRPKIEKIIEDIRKDVCWGCIFARTENYKSGYLDTEAKLVRKYLKPSSKVLVIASGNGREARPIAKQGHKIVCFDISFIYTESAKKLFAREGIQGIRLLQADYSFLPFKEKIFDFIFYTMYSVKNENRIKTLENISKLLIKDGLILLATLAPIYAEKTKLPLSHFEGYNFVQSEDQLKKEIKDTDLEIVESHVDKERPEYRFSIVRKKLSSR